MAYVLSSVSGNLISAASAGYAPTNSADVSAIASAYQVVSATATQLYAGTSYLTGVNSAPISAERAGNAANAALATSAWYDGTGRFISSLPDSAAVSSIASAYAESAASSKQDTLSFAYNAADQISSINGSALGGMDEAAVSGIASAYSESAASGKLDASASSSFYTTANESGFITGVDLSPYQTTADMSGYIPTSMSSDFQQASAMTSYALSSDVSATVDLVGTQSANWGGSALQLSAGPGVSLTKSGNTLIAGLDETVLWSGAGSTTGSTINLSESLENFERYGIYYYIPYAECGPQYVEKRYSAGSTAFYMTTMQCADTLIRCFSDYGSMNATSISLVSGRQAVVWYTGASVDWYDGYDRHHTITKIVGINRTAGV